MLKELDLAKYLARNSQSELLNVWSGSFLCLLASTLKIARSYLVKVLEEQADSCPELGENLIVWAKRFTVSVLTYYAEDFNKKAGTFSKLNLLFSEAKISENACHLSNSILTELAQIEIDVRELYDIKVMLCFENRFPRLLKEIANAPALLFYIGKTENMQYNCLPTVAIVGSRHMTNYGAMVIRQLMQSLSLYKLNIASGLAYGCDITAHNSCLDNGLIPIAILPNGLAKCYPSEHRPYLNKIKEKGFVFSEFLPWQMAQPSFFAARNRLISGLAQLVVIIEAAQKSGSLITASFAATQGREVLAVPGAITQAYSVGCNNLILDGCQPYLGAEQVTNILNAKFAIYPLQLKETFTLDADERNLAADKLPINEVTNLSKHAKLAALICQSLQENVSMLSQDLYACVRQTKEFTNNLEIGEFLSTLELLELTGKVKKQRMQYYLASG